MVDYVQDPNELLRRLRVYAFTGNIEDAELRNKLQTIPGVTADVLTEAAELLYAYKDALDEQGIRVLAELWTYANEQNWTTFVDGPRGSGNRAEKIISCVRHELGELKGKAPKPEDMPQPQVSRRNGRDWRIPDRQPTGEA